MKKLGVFRILFLLLVFAGLCLKITSGFFVNYIWFKDLGFQQLFTTPIIAKLQIGAVAFVIYFLIIFFMGLAAYRVFLNAEREEVKVNKFHLFVVDNLSKTGEKDITPINTKIVIYILLLISCIFSLLLSLGASQSGWMKLLEYRNATDFGIKDLVFNKDVAFYVFKMPLYSFVLDSLTVSLTILFIISMISYPLTGLLRFRGPIFSKGSFRVPHAIRRFWAC